jgi:DNA-binding NtrC family response regulator
VSISERHPGGLKAQKMEPRPHVIVVEDEPTQRHLLVDYLARQNFRVSGVNGGAELRKLVARERPELVRSMSVCRMRMASP